MDSNTPTSTKKAAAWAKTAVPGLYLRNTGTYYSRYSLNGRRTWRSLDTNTFSVAKLRHERQRGKTEENRQAGMRISTDLKTLGALAAAIQNEVEASTTTSRTKVQYRLWLARLREHWQQGEFDTTLARNVTRDTITTLRRYLSERAPLRCGNWQTEKRGYRPAVVNQTLTMLRILLSLAVQRGVIPSNPFSEVGPFGGSVYMPNRSRRPEIPSNEVMERVFCEMARVALPEGTDPVLVARAQADADASAEFARFLAYSGARAGEAALALVSDDLGTTIRIRGYKSETSDRTIPVIPPLRALLDSIKSRRISGQLLAVSGCLKALRRACQRLGVPVLRQHDLRHYFATCCIESGVPIPTVSDWLGHADGGTLLMKRYRHLRDRHSLEAAKLVTLQTPAALSRTA